MTPAEQNDLSAMEPGRARRMRDSLDSWFDEVESERLAISGANRQPETVAARFR